MMLVRQWGCPENQVSVVNYLIEWAICSPFLSSISNGGFTLLGASGLWIALLYVLLKMESKGSVRLGCHKMNTRFYFGNMLRTPLIQNTPCLSQPLSTVTSQEIVVTDRVGGGKLRLCYRDCSPPSYLYC